MTAMDAPPRKRCKLTANSSARVANNEDKHETSMNEKAAFGEVSMVSQMSMSQMSMSQLKSHVKVHNIDAIDVLERKKRGKYEDQNT